MSCAQMFTKDVTEACYAQAVTVGPADAKSVLIPADVDGDGHVDIIVVGSKGGITVWLGDGAGELVSSVLTPADPAQDAAAGDFDGDGLEDLVVSFPGATPRIDLLHNDGDGHFSVEASFLTGPTVGDDLAFGDFDGDGDLDAVAIHQGVYMPALPKRLTTLTNAGGGEWGHAEQTLTMFAVDITMDAWAPYLTTGDFDGVHTDVVVGIKRSVNQPHQMRSNGAGTFDHAGPLVPDGVLTGYFPLLVHDIDGDGRNDLIAPQNNGTTTVATFKNNGGGMWSPLATTSIAPALDMAVGDFIHDTDPDLVSAASAFQGQTTVHSIRADGTLEATPMPLGFVLAYVSTFTVADLNEDGHTDFVYLTNNEPMELRLRLSE